MLTQSNTSKNIKSLKPELNNEKVQFNRGIDVILNGGKRKQNKTFHVLFNNIVCFFNTEIDFYLEFSLNLRKKK